MFFKKNQKGQVLVEAALVMPLMVFFTLGIMQMTMMQQARIMTDYAAYAAARSGVVNNADSDSMVAAANIAILPTVSKTNNLKSFASAYLKNIIGRFISTELENALKSLGGSGSGVFSRVADMVQGNIKGFLKNSLGLNTYGMASVVVTNPLFSDFQDLSGMTKDGDPRTNRVPEDDDFDNLDSNILSKVTSARGLTNREKNILTVAVSYNYELKIPFANWIIFEAWSASQVGLELTGAIWSARVKVGGALSGFTGNANATGNGGMISRNMTNLYHRGKVLAGDDDDGTPRRVFQKIRIPLSELWGLKDRGIYVIPLYSSYSMRMHSNVYKSNLSKEVEQLLMSN